MPQVPKGVVVHEARRHVIAQPHAVAVTSAAPVRGVVEEAVPHYESVAGFDRDVRLRRELEPAAFHPAQSRVLDEHNARVASVEALHVQVFQSSTLQEPLSPQPRGERCPIVGAQGLVDRDFVPVHSSDPDNLPHDGLGPGPIP
jgi:hypothetical protein